MRLAPLPALVVSLAACASSGSSSVSPPPPQLVIADGATMRLTRDDGANVHVIPFAPDRVWRALPAVFDSLGIPIGMLEPSTKTIGNQNFKLHGRLKNVPLSRYIDCGTSTQIGSNADSYDVNLTFLAEVRPGEAGSTKVTTTIQALARPANFAQEYSQCSSKGSLEARLVTLLKARLESSAR
jgi:hypothetical protein